MILDKRENALSYLGISKNLDAALHALHDLSPEKLAVNTRVDIITNDVFYTVGEPVLCRRPMSFEHHRRFMDIHVPITGTEELALCQTDACPADAPFDEQKDIGFFEGKPTTFVKVPAGWFLLCLPQDAHVPALSDEEHAIVKVVFKVRVS